MIAARFRSVGWVAAVAIAALICYLVSQSVAAERASLGRVDRQIAETRSDIERLTMEIGTRARMSQLEDWNTEVLALQAPAPQQFVSSAVQLASLEGGRSLPLDPAVVASKGAVTAVAYPAQPAAPQPAAVPVAAPAPAPVAPALPTPHLDQPLLRAATYVKLKPERLATDPMPAVTRVALVEDDDGAPVAAPAKPHRAKPLSLLPDDIDALVAAERAAHKARSRPAAR